MSARVCILTTVHPPFDTRIFHKQAKMLAQASYDVTLIAQYEGNEMVDGVRIMALPKPRNRLSRIFGLTWRAFRLALRERADIYHFHDPELLPIGLLLKLFTRARIIYDVHESYAHMLRVKHWIPRPLRGPAALIVSLAEQLAARFLDAVVVASESIQARFPQRRHC